ncbi:MAG: metallophosphoesterase [Dehalococcoidia bacterium]|nr:metallophosphoesterase [Dehalococcoidia bacterium]
MVRFIHTSDWQLGMTRRFLSPEAQSRFTDARLQAIRTIGEKARERDAAFVVVAGDVFESNMVERQLVQRALHAMKEAAVPFYLLPGNHDPLAAGSVFLSGEFTAECPPNVVVLDGTPIEAAPGVTLVSAPWRSKKVTADPIAEGLRGRGGHRWHEGTGWARAVRDLLTGHGVPGTDPAGPRGGGGGIGRGAVHRARRPPLADGGRVERANLVFRRPRADGIPGDRSGPCACGHPGRRQSPGGGAQGGNLAIHRTAVGRERGGRHLTAPELARRAAHERADDPEPGAERDDQPLGRGSTGGDPRPLRADVRRDRAARE